VGRALVNALRTRGARVIALSRASDAIFAPAVETRRFDPNGAADPAAFADADAVVHLAGESVAGRWTPQKRRRIADSRIAGTQTVVASLAGMARRPSVLVSASAVGYYGDRSDEMLTEESAPANDFLAGVCVAWEAAAARCEALGIRSVRMRTGIAFGNGGALAQMAAPFKLGIGGPLGSGRQYVPWIAVEDLADLYCYAIENAALRGAINAVTPDYATNARLAQAIGAALHRPAFLPTPAFALHIVLGGFASSVLASQRIVPAVAQANGFRWTHPQLEAEVARILGRERDPAV
jgi:uncharacterized protein